MSESRSLPLAYAVLRALIVLNWLFGAVVLSILVGLFAASHWTMTALGAPPDAETATYLMGLRAIAALGLLGIPLSLALLKRLSAMVLTVRASDPFVAANAYRLQAIAWILLAQQLLSLIVAFVGRAVSTPTHQLHLSAGFSPSGWLAVVLAFVLARVFAEGALMRQDLEGTV